MKLSKEELQQLIDEYRSELRLLTHRAKHVGEYLRGLEREERLAVPKRKPGRPSTNGVNRQAKRGRPPGKAKGGYRLNVWDEIVLQTLKGRKRPGIFSDFYKAAKKNPASKGLSEKDLYARINQSLHKLANKRQMLRKVEHEGRGFGYSLT